MDAKRLIEIRKRKLELRDAAKSADAEKLDEIERDLDELEKEEGEIEKRSKICQRLSEGADLGSAIEMRGGVEERSYGLDSKEYRSAFFKTLAGVGLSDVEKRAMTTGSTSAGVAVPTITMNKIYEKIEQDSIVYGMVTVSHLKGNVVIPLEKTTKDVERLAEGADATVADDTLGELRLGAKKYIKLIRLTCELVETSIDALEGYLVQKLSKKLMRAIDYDIVNGDGAKGAKGILTTITPIETATAGTIEYDDLCDLFAALPAGAKKNATLMMSTNTLYKNVKKIKDNEKRPIFDVHENKVLGRIPVENDDVPDGVILFGDFSTYEFNWAKEAELSTSREAAFASGDSMFRVLALADGGLADIGAMVALKMKAGEA